MDKISVQNLGLIITNKCNLNCAHCERGCKNNKDMSNEVIKATLDQMAGIGNLCICGGEATFALDTLEAVFNYIIDNNIYTESISMVINGTNYSKIFLDLLKNINDYIKFIKNNSVFFNISYDIFHEIEIRKKLDYEEYVETIKKYTESPFFNKFQELQFPVFREGNATYLSDNLTVPLKPFNTFITYASTHKKFDEKGLCNIGPVVAVNTDGIITECDASIENQNTIYNYGNVLTDRIEDVMLKRSKVVKPKNWLKEIDKEVEFHNTYK